MQQILYSKISGDHPQHLIIVHGLFGQLDNWNTLAKQYANYYTTHIVDLRNHGRSFHDNETSHQAMANDIINYMNHHHINKANLLGHSLGGKVVMHLALNNPEYVERLIVADMAPKTYPPHHQDIIAGLKNVDFSKVDNRSDVEPYLEEYIKSIPVRQFLMKNVYRTENGKYAFRFNLKVLSENYSNLVSNTLPDKKFDKPTLFLKGENSNYITAEDTPIIHHYFPTAKIVSISKAGHWLHAENPKSVLENTLDFISNS